MLCAIPPIQNNIHTNLVRFFWFFLPNPSNQIHAVVMPVSSIFPPMPNSCQMHAGFSWIQSRRSSNTIRLFWYCFDSLMLNSCWFQFHLECQNALRNTLHDNCFAQYSTWQWCWPHAEFMLNPCWIQANPWKLYVFTTFATCREIPDYVSNNWRVIIIILNKDIIQLNAWNAILLTHWNVFHGFAWIQNEFGMNLAPVWFQVLYKALWNCKNETSMNFAWAQQWNSTWKWNQHEINMNPAWLRHDFNTNMVSISVPSNFRDDKFKIVNS